MNKPIVSAIAVIGTRTRVLGRDNELVWDIPNDLKRFKEMTMGHPIVMGRKTFESIGRPLPGRTNIVITRDKEYKIDGCEIIHSIDGALEKARELDKEEIFIIGGGQIFAQTLDQTDRLYLTLVDSDDPGDVMFPEYKNEFTKEISRSEVFETPMGIKYTYVNLERT